MYKKLLVPLDGSLLAESALEPARQIAKCMDAELVLFRVLPPPPNISHFAKLPEIYGDIVEGVRVRVQEYLQMVRERWPDERIRIQCVPAGEPVADQIIDYAKQKGIDLIVISSHGRTGMSRWVHGSVTERVLRGAHCATLVVRDE